MSNDAYRGLRPPEQASPASEGRDVVAAIGIDEYQYWPKLKNAVKDAHGVFDLCGQMGFAQPLPLLTNEEATGTAIMELIGKLKGELRAEDRLLLFFAGHGHTHVEKRANGPVETGYLIPVDAGTDLLGDYLEIGSFLRAVAKLPPIHILVILDSCGSGFALGRDVEFWPKTEANASGRARRLSRRVITSASRDQPAEDGGPVKGHSVFAGILLQGLDWGTADLTGDGQVTTSELGVFLAHRVPKASRCGHQVPDFGAFEGDDRVDMAISLRSGTYHALKTQAWAALQLGDLEGFCRLVDELKAMNPEGSWTLFLAYRQTLLKDQSADQALWYVHGLRGREDVSRGMLPVSEGDLVTLGQQLKNFSPILEQSEAADNDFPLGWDLTASPSLEDLLSGGGNAPPRGSIGGRRVYELAQSTDAKRFFAQFQVTNRSDKTQHIYFLAIRPDGRLVLGPLLHDPQRALDGLKPGDWALGTPFEVANVGLTETRLFCSPRPIPHLLLPPTTATRGDSELTKIELSGLLRRTVWYRVMPSDDERERLKHLRKG
jgi:hypothetical protein